MGHSSERWRDAFLTNSHLLLDDGSKGVPVHGTVPTTLIVVMGLAALMALMACANIASLLLVRVAHRTREISVRCALGAQRRRLIQQLLAEGLLLGLTGGVLGIFAAPRLAAILGRFLVSAGISHFGLTSAIDLRIFLSLMIRGTRIRVREIPPFLECVREYERLADRVHL